MSFDNHRDRANQKLAKMRSVIHFVERFEGPDPHPKLPRMRGQREPQNDSRNIDKAVDFSKMTVDEIIFHAARLHPLNNSEFVNLTLVTESPVWTYSRRQMKKLFLIINEEISRGSAGRKDYLTITELER